MNIIRYSIRSFFTNEYYSIIRFASKRLFVATLCQCLGPVSAECWLLQGTNAVMRSAKSSGQEYYEQQLPLAQIPASAY